MKEFETNGLHNGEPVYCPVNGWDCPYYNQGLCCIADPVEDCDDFASFFPTREDWEEA